MKKTQQFKVIHLSEGTNVTSTVVIDDSEKMQPFVESCMSLKGAIKPFLFDLSFIVSFPL